MIIPAILTKKFLKIKKQINLVKDFINFVQIDICDGKFVPKKTFASNGRKDSFKKIEKITKNLNLELDMMIKIKNIKHLEKWLNSIIFAKPKKIIFHFDSMGNLKFAWDKIFNFFNKYPKIKIGLGVCLKNKDEKVFNIFKKHDFDFVQFMGIIKIGQQGQKFDKRILKKIKIFHKKFPSTQISVDGGVKLENAKQIIDSGAMNLASGSEIFTNNNPKDIIKKFQTHTQSIKQ
jgi:ribulose-phosphate 3-epimerase